MNILLHICCAPCLIYPYDKLRAEGFNIEGLYYNPNIHPFNEYNSRRQAIEQLSRDKDIKVSYPEYRPEEFFQAVNHNEATPQRCAICWQLRLRSTARQAKEKGFSFFTTTLLVSPYQDQQLLKQLGEKIAKDTHVGFYYEDFRPGFRAAHEQAKAKGIYCQKYCGCIYSEIERFNKPKNKAHE